MADTVPAMLEPGEYVIRKDAAEELGPSFLNMLNNADRVSNQSDREMPSTWGQSFVERFPSQHSDTERAAGQERGLSNLIDMISMSLMLPPHPNSNRYMGELIQSLLNGGRQQVPQENNKQQGGYIDEYRGGGYADMQEDYSLLDLMMPIMDDRLGPVGVKKYSHGGDVYGGFGVSPEQVFQEQGLQWDPEYGETLEKYDPTMERQLGQSLMGKFAAPGAGAGTFAETGGYGTDIEAREKGMRGYYSGVAGYRGEHRGGVESQIAEDITAGTFEFEEARAVPNFPTLPQYYEGPNISVSGQHYTWNSQADGYILT